MDKDKNRGLADNQEGEFVLNESGTSVSIDPEIDFSEDEKLCEREEETNAITVEETGETKGE